MTTPDTDEQKPIEETARQRAHRLLDLCIEDVNKHTAFMLALYDAQLVAEGKISEEEAAAREEVRNG